MIKRILDLRLFRKQHNIKSQKELAEMLDMPLSSLNKYELNGTDPNHLDLIPLSLLIKISDRYQIKIDDILTKKQFINTENPLIIEKDYYADVFAKQSKLCLPIQDFWQKINDNQGLNIEQKNSFFYLLSNELRYFCNIYHKPVLGFVSKYNQDSVSLIQMLLGDDLSRKEEIINALNSTKPIYFSYSKDNTEYIQYYKCKKENNFFLDINIVDYTDFAFSNFEITNQEDYDFSVCYLNNELLEQISIVKFEYKDATDEDAFFSKYQHLYACDILILAEKTKIEFQKDKAAKENIHSCSIYNYITDIETSIRKLNDIKTRKNICSTVAMGGEDINETDFINLKTGLYNEIISYYELDNKHSINWITNYINRINTILNQVIAEKEIKNQSSELLNKEFESILKTLNISNSLNESIFAELDLHKIDKGAKELIETISENQNNKEKSSYDCSQLKKLFALDIEFIFGYYHSFIKQNLSESYLLRCTEILRILNSKLRDFSNLNYFLLMLDIVKSISTQINQNEGKVEHAPSDYSMNHGVLTIENIVNYISYQVLSIYNSKAFKLAEKVKFYHRTDPYLSKIKKIVKRIKETDIENESETKIVNQKIEDAFMHIKNLFDECMNNFSYFINNPEEKSILKDFISINKEILKYPDLSGECNPHFQRD